MKTLPCLLIFVCGFLISCEETDDAKPVLTDEAKRTIIDNLNSYEFSVINYYDESHSVIKRGSLLEYEATDYSAHFEVTEELNFKIIEVLSDCNYVDPSKFYYASNEEITELSLESLKDVTFKASGVEGHNHYICTIELDGAKTVTTNSDFSVYDCDKTIDDRNLRLTSNTITKVTFNLSENDIDKVTEVFKELVK